MLIDAKNQKLPLMFDHWVLIADEMFDTGRFDFAAKTYNYIASVFKNVPRMKLLEANALLAFGDFRGANRALDQVTRISASFYLLKARVCVRLSDMDNAIVYYEMAKEILERKN